MLRLFVRAQEFIEGILRCKGQARAIDQVAMRAELRQMDRKISRLSNRNLPRSKFEKLIHLV